ncbi:MAG: AlpA family transcriptional regulator [Pseudomonadota bacterium]
MTEQLLRRPEVEKLTGLPRSTLYERIADGSFPKQIKIGRRGVRWRSSEVDAWIQRQIDEAA